jgi:quercetin dioxygenase-like cupin family protein
MDITNAKIEPVLEHGGTVTSYFMFPKESLREATQGSYLEFIDEFEIAPGTRLEPHYHNTHEFYYVLAGHAWMQIADEKQEVSAGDLVHIPPKAPHTIWPSREEQGVRCLGFAASFQKPGETYTVTTLPDLD